MKEIRELAKRFTPQQLEECISQQLKEGANICELSGPTEEVIKVLSKAEYVKNLMTKGTSLTDAVRDLARKIRQVQDGFLSRQPQ